METKVKLVNEVEGSIVSDQMLNKVDDIADANLKIGQLQGEINVLSERNDALEEKLDAEKESNNKIVTVVVSDEYAYDRSVKEALHDSAPDTFRKNITARGISKIVFDNKSIVDLANDATKALADKTMEEAKNVLAEVKTSKKSLEDSKKKWMQDKIDFEKKVFKNLQHEIDEAQYENLQTIKNLKNDIKVSKEEISLIDMALHNAQIEQEINMEAMTQKLNLYKSKIVMLSLPRKDRLKAILTKMFNKAMWARMINTYDTPFSIKDHA